MHTCIYTKYIHTHTEKSGEGQCSLKAVMLKTSETVRRQRKRTQTEHMSQVSQLENQSPVVKQSQSALLIKLNLHFGQDK